jgi:hypothetical protein
VEEAVSEAKVTPHLFSSDKVRMTSAKIGASVSGYEVDKREIYGPSSEAPNATSSAAPAPACLGAGAYEATKGS